MTEKEYYVDAISVFKVRYKVKATSAEAAIMMVDSADTLDLDYLDQVHLNETIIGVSQTVVQPFLLEDQIKNIE
jgi:hypothetical protein